MAEAIISFVQANQGLGPGSCFSLCASLSVKLKEPRADQPGPQQVTKLFCQRVINQKNCLDTGVGPTRDAEVSWKSWTQDALRGNQGQEKERGKASVESQNLRLGLSSACWIARPVLCSEGKPEAGSLSWFNWTPLQDCCWGC